MGSYSSRCPTSGLAKLAPAGLGSVADGHFAHDSRADYLRGTVRLVYDPPTSSPWLAPRNAHTRVRERAGFETRWRRPSAAVLLAILSDRRKSEAEGRGTTQPSPRRPRRRALQAQGRGQRVAIAAFRTPPVSTARRCSHATKSSAANLPEPTVPRPAGSMQTSASDCGSSSPNPPQFARLDPMVKAINRATKL
jgi:hypothetical protein